MTALDSSELSALFLGLGVLLGLARLLGEVARRFNQPAVLGEILAGVILGPTVLGRLSPALSGYLFPASGAASTVFETLMVFGISLFLLVAGLEVNLSAIWRQGKAVLIIGAAGIVFPFVLGFGMAEGFPTLMGMEAGADPLIFALFIATALSISALPVIAKTLMDLNLYRSDLGMTVVAAAVLNDLIGWIIFALILGMMGTTGHAFTAGETAGLTLLFAVFMLTLGRWTADRLLLWIGAHSDSPGGVIGFVLSLTLISAALTEAIGIHLIFGAFLAGVALGDSRHLRARIKAVMEQFVAFIFAPLFFASIGLKVDFIANFDLPLVALVLVIACIGKIIGCGLGARLGGFPRRESWALGFAMNARGAMEIILGLLALQNGLISERLFVALVAMALVTSLMSGPGMQAMLQMRKPSRFFDYLGAKAFRSRVHALDRDEAIREMSALVGAAIGRLPESLAEAALARERQMPTGVGHGVAVPHARIDGLEAPVVGVGISTAGIDFDAPDGEPAHLIFLLFTPMREDGLQLEILADIARTFREREVRERAMKAKGYREFLALVKSGEDV